MPSQARYTPYKDLPDPAHQATANAEIFRQVWKYHNADILPVPFRKFFKVGVVYLPEPRVLAYGQVKDIWTIAMNPALYILNSLHRQLDQHELAPLLSLATDIGATGLAASEVYWWLVRVRKLPSRLFRQSWMKYVAPWGEIESDWIPRREQEAEDFLLAYKSTPLLVFDIHNK